MKTSHYLFTTWKESAMVSGSEHAREIHHAALVPESREKDSGNIIDLTAWRAANQGLAGEPWSGRDSEPDESWSGSNDEPDEPEVEFSSPRPRKSERAMVIAELISTLSVAAVAAVIILRVLTF